MTGLRWSPEGARAHILTEPIPDSVNRRVRGWVSYHRHDRHWWYAAFHADGSRTVARVPRGRHAVERGRRLVMSLLGVAGERADAK